MTPLACPSQSQACTLKLIIPHNCTAFQLRPSYHKFKATVFPADVQACEYEKSDGNTKRKMQRGSEIESNWNLTTILKMTSNDFQVVKLTSPGAWLVGGRAQRWELRMEWFPHLSVLSPNRNTFASVSSVFYHTLWLPNLLRLSCTLPCFHSSV